MVGISQTILLIILHRIIVSIIHKGTIIIISCKNK